MSASAPLTDAERIEVLEGALASLWENTCDGCGRPFHPRQATCYGCELDSLRAELAQRGKHT